MFVKHSPHPQENVVLNIQRLSKYLCSFAIDNVIGQTVFDSSVLFESFYLIQYIQNIISNAISMQIICEMFYYIFIWSLWSLGCILLSWYISAGTSHLSSAQWPHGAGGYCNRQCSLRCWFWDRLSRDFSLLVERAMQSGGLGLRYCFAIKEA